MAVEVTLSLGPGGKTLVAFDERVLEFFWPMSAEGSERFHLAHLKAIQITADKKGKHALEVKTTSGRSLWAEVALPAVPAAQQLVAAVQQAMAASPSP